MPSCRSVQRRVYGCVVACVVLFAVAAAPSATAEPSPRDGRCGKPLIDVWYDRDQFGQYLKVKFKTPCGPVEGGRGFISGFVVCKPSNERFDTSADGVLPVSTDYMGLPAAEQCPALYAEAYIQYKTLAGGASNTEDAWGWDWGNYPA